MWDGCQSTDTGVLTWVLSTSGSIVLAFLSKIYTPASTTSNPFSVRPSFPDIAPAHPDTQLLCHYHFRIVRYLVVNFCDHINFAASFLTHQSTYLLYYLCGKPLNQTLVRYSISPINFTLTGGNFKNIILNERHKIIDYYIITKGEYLFDGKISLSSKTILEYFPSLFYNIIRIQ